MGSMPTNIVWNLGSYLFLALILPKPTGTRPLGRPGRRWEGNVRMNLKKYIALRGIGLIRLGIGIIEEHL